MPKNFFLTVAILCASCHSYKVNTTVSKFSSGGYASSDGWFWSKSQKAFVKVKDMIDAYFWYKDSLLIYENYVHDSETYPDGHTESAFSILSYTFLDLRSKQGYDYLHFSDTAKCIKSRIILPDERYGKIWAFVGEMPYNCPDSTVKEMADTIMNGTKYKRFSAYETFKHDDGDQVIYHHFYLNCDVTPNHRMFQFDKEFSRKYGKGCPMQWEISYYIRGDLIMGGGFVFHRDSLTKTEHRIFDTWEKYALEHPVKQ